jgi:hypothetical protein
LTKREEADSACGHSRAYLTRYNSAMRYQDQVVKLTQKALGDVCRSASAVPADKLDWVPMGESRSVLNQMQEIATSATWFLPLVESGVVPVFDQEMAKAHTSFRRTMDHLEECIVEARQSTGQLCQAIIAFPDADLDREVVLPFGGGKTTMADVLQMHHWNMVYHLGQINQIQLMLGDAKMH